jgi:hypothetical protein
MDGSDPTRRNPRSSGQRISLAVLLIGIAGLVALGAKSAVDYGVSWDVARSARLGSATLRSYRELTPPTEADRLHDLDRHGPFGVAITEWATGVLAPLWPGRHLYQTRYFVQFLWFALGVGVIYALARRWVRPLPALITAALWATQPLFFGHGFINPFDGPFTTLFGAAMLTGYHYVDVLGRQVDGGRPAAWNDVREEWALARRSERLALLAWLAIVLAVTADTLFLHRAIYPVLERTVRAAYAGTAWSPISDLFRLVAEDAARAAIDVYLAKLWSHYTLARWGALLALALPAFYLLPRVFPRAFSASVELRPVPASVFAGGVLGLAFAARMIAPIAGLLVSLLVLARTKYRGVQSLVVYWAAAAIVGYLAWPSLWSAPWTNLLDFVRNTALLPFDIPVLFAGDLSRPANLPWNYLPSFILLQTTLPALVLTGTGAYLASRRQDGRRAEYVVTGLWFALPILLAIALGTTLYDNGRHYLFLWTAAFLFAAVAIEWVLAWRVPSALKVGLVVAGLLPGIIGIWRLHPYEYIYFNEGIGGVRGAFRRYELDYWATSYRAAMAYVNNQASPDAWIAVGSARELFDDYARGDLHLAPEDYDPTRDPGPEFAVTTTRANGDLAFFPEAPVVFRVEVDGATLAVVRDLR